MFRSWAVVVVGDDEVARRRKGESSMRWIFLPGSAVLRVVIAEAIAETVSFGVDVVRQSMKEIRDWDWSLEMSRPFRRTD